MKRKVQGCHDHSSKVQEVYSVELAEARTLDCWTKDWTRELLFKTWLFKLQHFTSTDTWLPYIDTSALQTRHLLTKYTCTNLTSRHLHTLALDLISLYTLATHDTHFTFSYNFTHLSLGALWHSSLHTHYIYLY